MSFETGQPSPMERKQVSEAAWDSLKQLGAVIEPDPFGEKDAYAIKFISGEAVTTIRIVFNDYTGADLVMSNMTTLPDSQKGKGLGSAGIQKLIAWARSNDLQSIRAVQVQKQNENFWQRNGFVRVQDPNPTKDFIFKNAEISS